MELVEQPPAETTSSDESFAPPPNAATPPPPTLVGAKDRPELEAGLQAVRYLFDQDMIENAADDERAEQRQAELISKGFENALDLLANKNVLRPLLVNIGLTVAKDDFGLMGQIAQLQLGRWRTLKSGATAWFVPSRRHDRLGRFYRIFLSDREKWALEGLREAITSHKGKSTGILDAAKVKKPTISKKEKADNRVAASSAKPMATAKLPGVKLGKQGEYQLILARVTGAGIEVCEVVQGRDTLRDQIVDEWAARAALTVDTDEVEEAAA